MYLHIYKIRCKGVYIVYRDLNGALGDDEVQEALSAARYEYEKAEQQNALLSFEIIYKIWDHAVLVIPFLPGNFSI